MYRLKIVFAECSVLLYWYFLLFVPENNYSDPFVNIPRNGTVISSSTFILMIIYSVTTAENEGYDVHLVAVTYIKFPLQLAYWEDVCWSYWRLPLIWFKLKILLCFLQQIFCQEFGPCFPYGSRTGLQLVVKNTSPISPTDESHVNNSLRCFTISKMRIIQRWDLKQKQMARSDLLNSCGWHQKHVH